MKQLKTLSFWYIVSWAFDGDIDTVLFIIMLNVVMAVIYAFAYFHPKTIAAIENSKQRM